MAVKPKRRYCAALPAATTSCSSLSVTPFAYVLGVHSAFNTPVANSMVTTHDRLK